MSKVFQLPILVTGVKTTLDKALEVRFHTRDVGTFSPLEVGELMKMLGKEYWAAFAETEVKAENIEIGKERVEKGEKTASQRLRARMYVYYTKTKDKTEGFDDWYKSTIETIGQNYLDKVEEEE